MSWHFLVFCVTDVSFQSPVFGGWKYVASGWRCAGSLVKESVEVSLTIRWKHHDWLCLCHNKRSKLIDKCLRQGPHRSYWINRVSICNSMIWPIYFFGACTHRRPRTGNKYILLSPLVTAWIKSINQSNVFIEPIFTSADVTKCYTETQTKTPNSINADVDALWLGKSP